MAIRQSRNKKMILHKILQTGSSKNFLRKKNMMHLKNYTYKRPPLGSISKFSIFPNFRVIQDLLDQEFTNPPRVTRTHIDEIVKIIKKTDILSRKEEISRKAMDILYYSDDSNIWEVTGEKFKSLLIHDDTDQILIDGLTIFICMVFVIGMIIMCCEDPECGSGSGCN